MIDPFLHRSPFDVASSSCQPVAMRASVVQFHPVQGESEANRTRAEDLLRRAAESGSQIVVLPELFATGPPRPHEDPVGIAEPSDGPTAVWLAAMATRYELAVAGTFLEEVDGKLYNRLLLAMPGGGWFRYAKRKLDSSEREHLTPGSETNVADTALGRLGLSVCMDASDQKMAAGLAASSVRAVLFPHATLATRVLSRAVFAWESRREPLMAGFARKVAAPVMAAGQVGPVRIKKCWAGNWMRGSTWIVGANGRMLAGLGFAEEGVATAEIR
jgi:predicted amidohydrolase